MALTSPVSGVFLPLFSVEIAGQPTWEAALSDFRLQMEEFSPEFQDSFRRLDEASRFHLIELFFGHSPHRALSRTDTAVSLARFLGETGFDRELALSLSPGTASHRAVLSLGEAESVKPEKADDILVLHTHPRTDEDIEELFLPSDPDLSFYMDETLRHARLWQARAGAALAVYDPDRRLFKNWIVSPYGISRTEVELGAEGVFAGVNVFYAVRPGFENDGRVLENLDPRRLDMRAFLKGRSYGTGFKFLRAPYDAVVQSLPTSLTERRENPEGN